MSCPRIVKCFGLLKIFRSSVALFASFAPAAKENPTFDRNYIEEYLIETILMNGMFKNKSL